MMSHGIMPKIIVVDLELAYVCHVCTAHRDVVKCPNRVTVLATTQSRKGDFSCFLDVPHKYKPLKKAV